MQSLAERQSDFGAALLDPERPAPSEWIGPDGQQDALRFAVYRNNVMSSLIEALAESYPAVKRLVGEEYFRALAKLFARQHPPVSPILLEYGARFPEFLAQFEPLATLPYLADVARIECAWLEAYHSAEAPALEASRLAAVLTDVPAERIADIRLLLHPTLRLVHSRFPAAAIWRMNLPDGVPAPIDLATGGQTLLLVRPEASVETRVLSASQGAFLSALAAGKSLGEASQAAIAASDDFDLTAELTAALHEGLFSDIQHEA
jgi:hypothetical protein